jgi:hypothetical protein
MKNVETIFLPRLCFKFSVMVGACTLGGIRRGGSMSDGTDGKVQHARSK